MRSGMLCALGLTLAVSMTAAARADEEPTEKTGNWFGRLFSFGKTRRTQQVPCNCGHHAENAGPPTLSQLELEAAAYHRRLAVFLKLYRIAEETRDEALRHRVEALDNLNWDQFERRTKHLPTDGVAMDQ